MTRSFKSSFTGSRSSKTLAATLAAALAFTPMATAPARADDRDAIAAAAFFGLVAAAIIASSRDRAGQVPHRPAVTPRRPLPPECRFVIRRGADRGSWYGQRCLIEHGAQWRHLPDHCAQWVELPRRHVDVVAYDAQCLAGSARHATIGDDEERGREGRIHGSTGRRDR